MDNLTGKFSEFIESLTRLVLEDLNRGSSSLLLNSEKTVEEIKETNNALFKSFGNIINCEGDVNVSNSGLIDLGELRNIGGNAVFENCKNLLSLNHLETVKGFINLSGCIRLKSLGNLKFVNKGVTLKGCSELVSLGNLETVGGHFDLSGCKKLTSFPSLKSVKGLFFLEGSGITKSYIKKEKPQLLNHCDWGSSRFF